MTKISTEKHVVNEVLKAYSLSLWYITRNVSCMHFWFSLKKKKIKLGVIKIKRLTLSPNFSQSHQNTKPKADKCLDLYFRPHNRCGTCKCSTTHTLLYTHLH